MCGINGWRQVKEDWESELMTDCCGSTTCRYIDTEGVDIQSAVVTWICGLIVSTTYSLQPHSEPSTAMKFKPHCTVQHPNRFRRAFVGRCMRTSSRRRYLSVRQFFANSTADRVSWPAKAEGSWASVTLHISLPLTPKNPVVHIFRIQKYKNTKITYSRTRALNLWYTLATQHWRWVHSKYIDKGVSKGWYSIYSIFWFALSDILAKGSSSLRHGKCVCQVLCVAAPEFSSSFTSSRSKSVNASAVAPTHRWMVVLSEWG